MKHPRPGFPRFVLVACLLPFALAACKREAEAPAPAPAPAMQDAPATPTVGAAKADPEPAAVEQPRLKVTTLDGAAYDLADYRGKWVVVNYWATWCGPCLEEMPELSALDAMREHVEVIGLAYEEIEPAALTAFLDKHPVVYPVAIIDVYDPPADFADRSFLSRRGALRSPGSPEDRDASQHPLARPRLRGVRGVPQAVRAAWPA